MHLLVSEVKSFLCSIICVYLKRVSNIFVFKKCVTNKKSLETSGFLRNPPKLIYVQTSNLAKLITTLE